MTEKLFTLKLTPYQHRMLRDLVWWAAHDIRKGPDGAAPFWSNNVMDEDWDESIATMQAISASLEPSELRPLMAPLVPGEVLGDEGIGGAEFTPEACAAEKQGRAR